MRHSKLMGVVFVVLAFSTCCARGTSEEAKLSRAAVQGILDAIVGADFASEFRSVAEVSLTLEGFGTDELPSQIGDKPARPFRAEDFDLDAVARKGVVPRGLKVLLVSGADDSVVVDAWAQSPTSSWYQRVALHQSGGAWFVDKVLAQAFFL